MLLALLATDERRVPKNGFSGEENHLTDLQGNAAHVEEMDGRDWKKLLRRKRPGIAVLGM